MTGSPAAPVFDSDELLAATRRRQHARLLGRERAVRWASAAGVVASAVAVALLAPATRPASLAAVVVAVAAYGVAYSIDFETSIGMVTPTELVFIPMLFALPARVVPLAVVASCGLAQLAVGGRRGDPVERVVVALGNAWFALAPALVLIAFHEPSPRSLVAWAVVALALGAQLATDLGRYVAGESAALGIAPRTLAQPVLQVAVIDLLLAPVGLLIAVAADANAEALLLPLPLLALLALHARERSRRFDHMLELSNAYRGTAFLLGDVVEVDDAYTGEHSRSVVDLVLAVSDRMGLDAATRRAAEFTALLHDVGKLRIPAEIINKPGPLTPEERAIIATHTIEGERLLAPIGGFLADVGHLVRSCHERWDGGGYPDGLVGEEIPLVARIVCCCDAWDAMTTDRPYRAALGFEEALEELREHNGSQFDPTVADTLEAVVTASRSLRSQDRRPTAVLGVR
jgi:HD-GYP domain-containing protein (c-di-GMP phosphodiesterase class II)